MTDPRTEQIAALTDEPGWEQLKDWARRQKDLYYEELARRLYAAPETVTPEAIREKQAYFKGMARLLNEPLFSLKSIERDLARRGTE